MKREKRGRTKKKTCHLFDVVFVLFLCCFYVVSVCHSLCSGVGGNSKKKRDLYRKISFDIRIKNNLRIT